MKKLILILTLIFCCNSQLSQASEDHILTVEKLVASASQHYPEIISYYDKVEAAKGSALASHGYFDIKLKHNYFDNSRGYYDGKINDSLVEKELGYMGAKVYGGYRKSDGSFPIYNGASYTNSDGEYRVGGKFSLLKNSTIDESRLGIIIANLGLEESKIQLEAIRRKIEADAAKAYWQWVNDARVLKIYEELYELALIRQKQLEEKFRKGDVAQIIVSENKKNILSRKNNLAKAAKNYETSAVYLSLFWRDNFGKPLIPSANQLPDFTSEIHEIAKEKSQHDVLKALELRPEIRIIKLRKKENLENLNYAKNLYKPQLDVDVSASKDLGDGPLSRRQSNNYVGINFSIPLQQREAKGKAAQYNSKINAIKHEQQLLEEKISAEIEQIRIEVNTLVEMHHNITSEAELAKTLENSEREKFKHGDSNFFLVNLREQDSATTKAMIMETFSQYQKALIDYKMAIFEKI